MGGHIAGAGRVGDTEGRLAGGRRSWRRAGGGSAGSGGPILRVGDAELSELLVVLKKVARASYLDLTDIAAEGRPGEIVIKARVYEPEEEYEDE